MTVLRCQHLQIRAGVRVLITALDWQVEPGQLWCVLGPNGVGKSTLLYTIAGLLKPASGMLYLDDRALADWPLDALARTRGLMGQQQVDAFSATVVDTVLIGRTPYRLPHGGRFNPAWDHAADVAAANAAMAAVGIEMLRAADVMRLSGGERQRVALATLLAQDPGLMLLDEPTAHQDVAQQLALMHVIGAQAAQHAVILSTHDINLTARFATHVLLLARDTWIAGTVASALNAVNLQHVFGCRFETAADMNGTPVFIAREPRRS